MNRRQVGDAAVVLWFLVFLVVLLVLAWPPPTPGGTP